MPWTAAFASASGGMSQTSGTSIWGVIFSGDTLLRINSYNNGGVIATGNILLISGSVFI
jgi:hypothetical protein